MSYTDAGSGASRSYLLDVDPMIAALQFQPADFELSHGWLRHMPSRHRFKFDKKGRVTIVRPGDMGDGTYLRHG